MRLPTDIKYILVCLAVGIPCRRAVAQVVQNNELHVGIIWRKTGQINETVTDQNKDLEKMYSVQTAINTKFNKIRVWEQKYNSYLKSARGYAETMKAGTTLYLDGIRTFQNLLQIQRAIAANPQGIGATLSMNDLYAETLAEFIKTYNLLKYEIAGEGKEHMLNGAERNDMLWNLSDGLQQLNKKLHELALSIAYYNLIDVWRNVTAGLTMPDHGMIANEALDRWKRTHRATIIINK